TVVPEAHSGMPMKLVRQVTRTGRSIHLRGHQLPPELEFDPYMQRVRPASALCIPLQHKGAVEGALYLENRVNPDVFSAGTRALLDVLCAQAAISLSQARFFQQLNTEVVQREVAQEELRTSLVEKKTLIRELQHRVKNNLQLVTSLLSLRLARIAD